MPQSDTDPLHKIENELRDLILWMASRLGLSKEAVEPLLDRELLGDAAEMLDREKRFSSPELPGDFHLVDLPDLPEGSFPFLFWIPRRRGHSVARDRSKPTACFVGCRFDSFRPKFQEILERVLGCYGYGLRFAELDGTKPILETILELLQSGDVEFACFNDRATERKPNVYIELGIAWTLGLESLLLHEETMDLPTNLSDDPPGITVIRYSSPRELARELTACLPAFLDNVSMSKP